MRITGTLVAPEHAAHHTDYTPRLRRDAATIATWLRTTISRPEPRLGRRGPICPYMPAALDTEAVTLRFHYGKSGENRRLLLKVLQRELGLFAHDTPLREDSLAVDLRSVLVVLPDTTAAGWAVMDDLHGDLKNVAVRSGLMIGQFHPSCDERAVHNSGFAVSRAPLGLFAIRRMAPHDLVFLHQHPVWFAAYQRRFDRAWRDGRLRDRQLRDVYDLAAGRHGFHALAPSPPGRGADPRFGGRWSLASANPSTRCLEDS